MTKPVMSPEDLEQLVSAPQESGVEQALATYKAVEQVYFNAVAATPAVVNGTYYATTTIPR
jgi:threonyl-tRNA synthetase